MSDLTATNCGCGCDNGNGMSSCLWIILLLCCCGGFGGNGFGGNGCGNDSCLWIILLLCCCGGFGGNGCGCWSNTNSVWILKLTAPALIRGRRLFAGVESQSPGLPGTLATTYPPGMCLLSLPVISGSRLSYFNPVCNAHLHFSDYSSACIRIRHLFSLFRSHLHPRDSSTYSPHQSRKPHFHQ